MSKPQHNHSKQPSDQHTADARKSDNDSERKQSADKDARTSKKNAPNHKNGGNH